MLLPGSFNSGYAELEPILAKAEDYVRSRLTAELADLQPVAIQVRSKQAESLLQKLQRGDISNVFELDDLVAARVVFLHSIQVRKALAVAHSTFEEVVEERNTSVAKPTDFSYKQPHLIVKLPQLYADRHPDLRDLKVEIQFTTYIQHALQEATHDLIYKGQKFSWREHRLDGQLRGLLEIVDDVLANLGTIAEVEAEPAYDVFDHRNSIIENVSEALSSARLPPDMRRFAISIEGILRAGDVTPDQIPELMARHSDLVKSLSLTPFDKILGALLREKKSDLVSRTKQRKFLVSSEFESLVPEVAYIPSDRRVAIEAPSRG